MSLQHSGGGGGAVSRVSPGGGALGEVLDRVLDKGIVIDAWAAVSLLGIEIVSIQAQVVVASVETYLKYAQAISSLGAPPAEASKAPAALGASGAEAPAAQPPKSLAEEPRPVERRPFEDEVVKYLGEHSGGLGFDALEEHFHASRAELEKAVTHLVDEHKVRKDPARDVFLPATTR